MTYDIIPNEEWTAFVSYSESARIIFPQTNSAVPEGISEIYEKLKSIAKYHSTKKSEEPHSEGALFASEYVRKLEAVSSYYIVHQTPVVYSNYQYQQQNQSSRILDDIDDRETPKKWWKCNEDVDEWFLSHYALMLDLMRSHNAVKQHLGYDVTATIVISHSEESAQPELYMFFASDSCYLKYSQLDRFLTHWWNYECEEDREFITFLISR